MSEVEARLVPPPARGHVSVARLAGWWYVACRSADLGSRPLPRTVLGVPLVLFRGDGGRAAAVLDRCPHRNVPLSGGRVAPDGALECPYHGWRFAGDGGCVAIPGLSDGEGRIGERRVPAFPVHEEDGIVWVWPTADAIPDRSPYRVPHGDDPAYSTVVRELEIDATLHAVVENALDVPHTAFLHRGLFRGAGERHDVTAIVRRRRLGVEAEFVGEPRPEGLAGRLLSPSGGVVEHHDRFLLPSIAQVEYRLGPENHLLVTSLCTPVEDFRTRMLAVVRFRLRLPSWLVRPLLVPVAMRIFRQDARILREQSATVRRFGGEQFASTEIDLLGPHVWRLLREAEAGAVGLEDGPAPDVEKRVVLRV